MTLLDESIKVVLFDFDDTLVGTHAAIWDLHRHIAKTYYQIDLSDEILKEYWGQPLPILAKQYYKTDLSDEAIARMVSHQLDFPKLRFPDTANVIRELSKLNKILGIVSATTRPILIKDAEIAEIPINLIGYIQTAEESTTHKPDPRVFDQTRKWLDVKEVMPNEVLYIGDGLQDALASTGAGFQFLGVTTGLVSKKDFEEAGFSSIKSLKYLIDL